MNDLRKTKKQLLEELQQERKRSDALYQVSNKLAGADTTDEVLDLIVNEAALLLSTDAAFIRSLQERVWYTEQPPSPQRATSCLWTSPEN